MTIHKEGYLIIAIASAICGGLTAGTYFLLMDFPIIMWSLIGIWCILFYLVVQFFRYPKRSSNEDSKAVLCPADGKVVVIEEVEETEYFKDRRIQMSIFMSPMNVHAQWYPISGKVSYYKYHPGSYLVAWHPKSSTENERSTIVVKHENGQEILFRQIAGAMARRIICYSKENDEAKAAENCGFIRFGSRVDVFFPLDAEINVELGDKVQGINTVLGKLS